MTLASFWPRTKLGELLEDIQPGFASGVHNSSGHGLPHLRPMNVSTDGTISRSEIKYVDGALATRAERRLRRGDVLFNNTNSPELVGKAALFDDDDEPAFSNHMTRLRADTSRLDPGFLALALHEIWRSGWFASHCNNHVSQASIGRKVLQDLEIPLPPLDVQRDILVSLRALGQSRRSAELHIRDAGGALAGFRESILAAACSGDLTSAWRQGHSQNGTTSNKADGLTAPMGWERTSLGQLCTRITSGSRDWTRYYGRGSGTFVMAQNVRRGSLDWSHHQAVDPPKDDSACERSRIEPGDLLITIVGANTADIGPVLEDRPEHYVCQSVGLLRPADTRITAFLNLWFGSLSHGRGYLLECAYGAGRPHLSFSQLQDAPVALPTLDEQHEILRRFSELEAMADSVDRHLNGTANALEAAVRSRLAKVLSAP